MIAFLLNQRFSMFADVFALLGTARFPSMVPLEAMVLEMFRMIETSFLTPDVTHDG